MKKNERLSVEEKIKLIEPIISGELSAKGVAKKYNMYESTLRTWLRKYKESGLKVCNTKVYLSAIIDTYDQSIVAWKISKTNDNKLVKDTLEIAFEANPITLNRRQKIPVLVVTAKKVLNQSPLQYPYITPNQTKKLHYILTKIIAKINFLHRKRFLTILHYPFAIVLL